MEWIFVETIENCGVGFNSYVSRDGKYCKQVWFDGYTEIFEIA